MKYQPGNCIYGIVLYAVTFVVAVVCTTLYTYFEYTTLPFIIMVLFLIFVVIYLRKIPKYDAFRDGYEQYKRNKKLMEDEQLHDTH